jgi:hypothetical protein
VPLHPGFVARIDDLANILVRRRAQETSGVRGTPA